jgi:hypothetical protein
MTGPQPHRDYPPRPANRLLTGLADLCWTLAIVALAYGVAVGLARIILPS